VTKYSVAQWLAHGGPSEENAAEIRGVLGASLKEDCLGLEVFERDGELWFGHNTCVFVLETVE
jgi:hypothetical protein